MKNLLSWQNIWNSRQITADIKEKLGNQEEVLCGGAISLIYLSLSNKSKPCHVATNSRPHNLKRHWKSTCDLTEIVNNYGLRRGKVCQIVRFISHFSVKLYIRY